jgi:hypothetical protein
VSNGCSGALSGYVGEFDVDSCNSSASNGIGIT